MPTAIRTVGRVVVDVVEAGAIGIGVDDGSGAGVCCGAPVGAWVGAGGGTIGAGVDVAVGVDVGAGVGERVGSDVGTTASVGIDDGDGAAPLCPGTALSAVATDGAPVHAAAPPISIPAIATVRTRARERLRHGLRPASACDR